MSQRISERSEPATAQERTQLAMETETEDKHGSQEEGLCMS